MTRAEKEGKQFLRDVLHSQADEVLLLITNAVVDSVKKSVLDEREACAKLAETFGGIRPMKIALAIRARNDLP